MSAILIKVSIISFIVGWIMSYVFNKYVKVVVSIKVKDNALSNNIKNMKPQLPQEIQNISILLKEIKKRGKLPINIKPQILESLKLIASTPNWEKQLDKNTIDNLNKIYNKWQRYLHSSEQSIQKIGKGVGFERPQYWEGTQEEFEQACKDGIIKENTIVSIISDEKEYKGSWITIDENGEISEYMD